MMMVAVRLMLIACGLGAVAQRFMIAAERF